MITATPLIIAITNAAESSQNGRSAVLTRG